MPFISSTGLSTIRPKHQRFIAGTQGYQSITFERAFPLSRFEVAGLTPGTYNININIDGAGAADVPFVVKSTADTWGTIVDRMSAAITGGSVELDGFKLLFKSDTHGITSTIAVLDGTSAGILAALLAQKSVTTTVNTAVAGVDDMETSGYQDISFATSILGTDAAGLAAADYAIDINIDSGGNNQLTVTVTGVTMTYAQIAAAIQAALRVATASTETVVVTDGVIRTTSATTGLTSTVVIAAGTAVTGGGDIIAALSGTIETAVNGTDQISFYVGNYQLGENGLPRNAYVQVISSAGVPKTDGIVVTYDQTAGTLLIGSGSTTIDAGDTIMVQAA